MEPTFFETPAGFRAWLEEHHTSATELWVGFHKKGSGLPSITWPESVDQALCFGWIDGVRKSLGDSSYAIRFTPRKPRSTWSAINVKRFRELTRHGLVAPAGKRAFGARSEDRTGISSFEQRHDIELDPAYRRRLRADRKAWTYFQAQAPWYRRAVTHWIMSAKREETRERRLASLIEHSAKGRTVPPLTRPAKRS